MSPEPWDLPVAIKSLKPMAKLIESYRAEGRARELGICLSRMSHLVKHVGTKDGGNAFEESSKYGEEAIHWLREAGEKKELARALRVACVPFCDGPHEEWLAESLDLSREIGDRVEEGLTVYRYTGVIMPSQEQIAHWETMGQDEQSEKFREFGERARKNHTIEEALAILESVNYEPGMAMCYLSLGVERKLSNGIFFERAIELYRKVGDRAGAEKAQIMMETFAPIKQKRKRKVKPFANKDWDPFRSLAGMVRLVLITTWDPIGVFGYPQTLNEYDRYVPPVVELLSKGPSVKELEELLFSMHAEKMVFRLNDVAKGRFRLAAEAIVNMHKNNGFIKRI